MTISYFNFCDLWRYCTHLPRRLCQWRSSDEIWCM